jgi:uncharacterized membrane protein YjjP (DUF1212 family)
MSTTEILIQAMLDMGVAMIGSGAEIYRAEDTLRRLGNAYGAEKCEVFIITSSIVVTLALPGENSVTQSKRIRQGVSNNFTCLEDLNALSRQVVRQPIPAGQLALNIHQIAGRTVPQGSKLVGYILAGSFFAVFFGGGIGDGIAAGFVGAMVWLMQRYLEPICMNPIVYQFIASLLSGLLICLVSCLFPFLQRDQIMIGDIMLLIPGVPFTNGFRDILLGDTLSGVIRLVEALVLAAVLALGYLTAIFLI